jgi:hypothetical protein
MKTVYRYLVTDKDGDVGSMEACAEHRDDVAGDLDGLTLVPGQGRYGEGPAAEGDSCPLCDYEDEDEMDLHPVRDECPICLGDVDPVTRQPVGDDPCDCLDAEGEGEPEVLYEECTLCGGIEGTENVCYCGGLDQ